MDKTSLGDRMKKNYENPYRIILPHRMPLIIRLDGKSFHSLTKKFDKPYDIQFKNILSHVAIDLYKNIHGCKLVYFQSDEISLLLTDYDKLETQPWFGKNLQKIVSVSASMASAYFNLYYNNESFIDPKKKIKSLGMFDSRAFVIPKEEVCNYFLFRQNDSVRNSIQGLGQKYFSHKELNKKSCNEIQDMLMLKHNINWNDTETYFKRGGCVYKCNLSCKEDCECKILYDEHIPIFSKDREFINRFVYLKEEL